MPYKADKATTGIIIDKFGRLEKISKTKSKYIKTPPYKVMAACAKATHAVKDRLRNNALDKTDTSTDSKDSNTNQEERGAKHLLSH